MSKPIIGTHNRIGFTGTRHGMNALQLERLKTFLSHYISDNPLKIPTLHHGDCKGADEQAHKIAQELGFFITIHPPENKSMRAFCTGTQVTMTAPQPYLVRNRGIVGASDCLVATPNTNEEQLRSGTWSTIRFARKIGRPVIVIYPSGLSEMFIGG